MTLVPRGDMEARARGLFHVQQNHRMVHALRILGCEVFHADEHGLVITVASVLNTSNTYWTTIEGREMAAALIKANNLASWSWARAARQFKRHPNLRIEFMTAYRLDADDSVLRQILRNHWSEKRARRKPHALEGRHHGR